jgi:predicted Holliday junction resolvase-like endonuclease
MKSDALKLFDVQRKIFGICPRSGEFFRLSDCRIFQKKKPPSDWLEGLCRTAGQLDRAVMRLDEKQEVLTEVAREKGRRQATGIVKRIDPVFRPRKLNPDDARVLCQPIDYVVFNGMNTSTMKNIILLDRNREQPRSRATQKSIEQAVQKGRYEWQTIRVAADGSIKSKQATAPR